MMGEMIHWAGKVPLWFGEFPDFSYYPSPFGGSAPPIFSGFFPDAEIADAGYRLGLTMSVDQYRRTYPEFVKKNIERWGSDFTHSGVAHFGAIDNACGSPNGYRPEFAKPGG